MDFLPFLAGLLLGAAIVWLIARERSALLRDQLAKASAELAEARATILQLTSALAAARADMGHLQERLQSERQRLDDMQGTLTEQFKAIADGLLIENGRRLQEQHKEKLEDVLSPFRETIDKFERKVDDTHRETIRENQSLREQLMALQKLNQTIGDEAKNLTAALKGQSKTQGNWGEVILERILEKSGLARDREYTVQGSHLTEDGRRLQPDVVIHLPENKNLVVDSKVSLTAFERYCSCDDAAQREQALAEHCDSIRRHVRELSAKNYQHLYGLSSLDFVLMFIPIEPAFNEAVNADPELYTEAFERNIIIVSTSTLLATLRTIASLWRQELQNQNAMEIARLGGELYDKFVNFLGDLDDLGRKMKSAQDSYDDALNKLCRGRGNLVKRAEDLKKLGAKGSKSIEPALVEAADQDAEPEPLA